jgi:hypothetical protein
LVVANIDTAEVRRAAINALLSDRHRLRQPNSCCGLTSCRRAISETFTLGSSARATVAIFSASGQPGAVPAR